MEPGRVSPAPAVVLTALAVLRIDVRGSYRANNPGANGTAGNADAQAEAAEAGLAPGNGRPDVDQSAERRHDHDDESSPRTPSESRPFPDLVPGGVGVHCLDVGLEGLAIGELSTDCRT
jgi:hypothetical protein